MIIVIKAFLKMMASPLPIIGVCMQLAFVAFWVVYGFLPAMAYWVVINVIVLLFANTKIGDKMLDRMAKHYHANMFQAIEKSGY